MRIGIIVLKIGKFQTGYYSLQDLGLAKALDSLGQEVIVYRMTTEKRKTSVEPLAGCKNATLQIFYCKNIGSSGLPDFAQMDPSLDVLIAFADNRLALPRVVSWTKKHGIAFYPYVGVLDSHSNGFLQKTGMNLLLERNLRRYRKLPCLAKTALVRENLLEKGVRDVTVAPVGLDVTLLNGGFAAADRGALREKYGFAAADKVILFIGRLVPEKRPLQMLSLFQTLQKKDPTYKLLFVGKGVMEEEVQGYIESKLPAGSVKRILQIPNKDIWELYRLADCFVNMNLQEIFGMAILEAMYYGCKVVSFHAPGPDLIIEDGVSGYLVSDEQAAISCIENQTDLSVASRQRILTHFTWESTAQIILNKIKEGI